MKRITRFLLLFISLFIIGSIKVQSISDFTFAGTTGYRVLERREENNLNYGVKHYIDKAETFRQSVFYNQEVNVLEIGAKSEAKLVSYGNLSNHKWTLTNVTNLAIQFEKENPEWKVLAAVNGDFFDINATGHLPYQTNNPLVTNGEYYKTSGANAVGIKEVDGKNVLVSGAPKKTSHMILALYDENNNIIEEFPVQRLNVEPEANQTSVFFGTYQSKTYNPKELNSESEKFVVGKAELALPNNANDFYGRGVITSKGNTTLQVGQFAIVTKNNDVINKLDIGKRIRVQFEFTGDFEGALNVTGQNAKFVTAGEYSPHPNSNNNTHARHPRTVLGIRDNGSIIISVIDGRDPASGREGMFGDEMAALMKSWGVAEAYNLDGGGSSYMVVKENGEFVLKSKPSDGRQRSTGNAVLVAVKVPHIDVNVNAKQNSLDFNLDVLKANGFDLEELYVTVGEERKEVIDGKVKFTDLEPNTEYYYEIHYKSGRRIEPLNIDGRVHTLKATPKVNFINIEEDDVAIKFSLDYSDPHFASNLKSAELIINGGKSYKLTNGEYIVFKSSITDLYESFKLIYSYNDNHQDYNIELENAPYRITTSAVTETLYDYFRIHNEFVLRFYN